MIINVKVIAGAKREAFEKIGDEYKIHLTEQPEKGKATMALIAFLAKQFNCSKSQIRIIKGFTSNKKIIEIKI